MRASTYPLVEAEAAAALVLRHTPVLPGEEVPLAAAPGLARVPVVAAWSALRPMTPDGMPVAGRAGLDNLYVHGGHGSIGMMTAPATARRLARAILWGEESPELVRLDPLRFSSREARSLA